MKRAYIILLMLLVSATVSAQFSMSDEVEPVIRRNVVYVQNFQFIPAVVYDRQMALGTKIGVIPSLGLGFYDSEPVPLFTASFYYGGNRKRGDIGLTYWAFEGIAVIANYMYTARSGFFAKVGLTIIPEEEGAPTLGLGYAF